MVPFIMSKDIVGDRIVLFDAGKSIRVTADALWAEANRERSPLESTKRLPELNGRGVALSKKRNHQL